MGGMIDVSDFKNILKISIFKRTIKKNSLLQKVQVVSVLFLLMTMAFFFLFVTSSQAITINGGSDEIIPGTSSGYTAAGCSGTVIWSVTGTGASVRPSGLITTVGAACGSAILTATCDDETSATKVVRISAGEWIRTCYGTFTPDETKCFFYGEVVLGVLFIQLMET